jgi:hypothetical protein
MTDCDQKKPAAVEPCGGGSVPAPRFRKSAAVVGGSSCPKSSCLPRWWDWLHHALPCQNCGEGSRGPAGGGRGGWGRPESVSALVPSLLSDLDQIGLHRTSLPFQIGTHAEQPSSKQSNESIKTVPQRFVSVDARGSRKMLPIRPHS